MSKGKLIGVTVLAVFAVSIAGLITLTQAGSDAPAPLVVETSTATIPPFVPTPPTAIDCKAPPPSGWMYEANDGNSCAVTRIPPCPSLRVNGVDVCMPDGTIERGPVLCAGPACGPSDLEIEYGGSIIRLTVTSIGADEIYELREWKVLPEHEDEFADLKAALLLAPTASP